jgi:hypothetical protein
MKLSVPTTLLACVLLSVSPAAGAASLLSDRDCREGADFIRNAALSRDTGMTATRFIDKLEEDLMAVRAYAPSLRWFVYSEVEEDLLRKAAVQVFEKPQVADEHRDAFLTACSALRVSAAYVLRVHAAR